MCVCQLHQKTKLHENWTHKKDFKKSISQLPKLCLAKHKINSHNDTQHKGTLENDTNCNAPQQNISILYVQQKSFTVILSAVVLCHFAEHRYVECLIS